MACLIVGVIIGTIITIWVLHSLDAFDENITSLIGIATLFWILITPVVTFLMLMMCSVIADCKEHSAPRLESSQEIIALGDVYSTGGTMYLGTGIISGVEYYYYIVKTDDDGYKMEKMQSTDATVYYTDSDFRAETWVSDAYCLGVPSMRYIHKIYIPGGSITDDMKIDLR